MILEIVWPITCILLLLVAIYFAVMAAIHAFRMYSEITPSKQGIANFLPFLVGAIPGLLTPAGERSRNRFLFSLAVAVASALASVLIGYFYGPTK
jgi:ABC-type spermidine/putrescine transport system permease subunit I